MKQPPVIPPCENDPRHPTDWICTGCGKGWCDRCISRVGLHHAYEVCPSCFERCERLDDVLSPASGGKNRKSQARASAYPHGSWAATITRAVSLPLRPPSVYLIAIAGAVFGFLQMFLSGAGWLSLLAIIVVYGYISQFWLELIRAEANGDEGMLDPQLDWEGLFHGFLMIFLALPFVLFGPGFIASLMDAPLASSILWGIGIFLTPMALVALALYDSGSALNPLFLVLSIMRSFIPYIGLCLLLAPLGAAMFFFDQLFIEPLRAGGTPSFPLLLLIARGICQIYLLWIAGRLLGGFYRLYEHTLGWS